MIEAQRHVEAGLLSQSWSGAAGRGQQGSKTTVSRPSLPRVSRTQGLRHPHPSVFCFSPPFLSLVPSSHLLSALASQKAFGSFLCLCPPLSPILSAFLSLSFSLSSSG